MLKKILKKGAVVFTVNFIQIPLNFISLFLIISFLGIEGRGLSFTFISLVAMLAGIFQIGFPTASIYYGNKNLYTKNEIIQSFALIIAISMSIILIIFFLFQDQFLIYLKIDQSMSIGNALIFSFLSIPVTMLFNLVSSMTLAEQDSTLYSKSFLIRAITNILLIILLVGILKMNFEGIILSYLISCTFALSYLFKYKTFFTHFVSYKKISKCLKQIFNWALKHYPSSLIPMIYISGAPLIIAPIAGFETVGLYSIAISISGAVSGFGRSISALLFGKLLNIDIIKSKELTINLANVLLFGTLFIYLILFILLPFLIPFFFSNEAIPAINAAYVTLFASIFLSVQGPVGSYLNANNFQLTVSIIHIISLFVFIFLMPFLTSIYFLLGACFSLAIARLISLILHLIIFFNQSKDALLIFSPIKFLKLALPKV